MKVSACAGLLPGTTRLPRRGSRRRALIARSGLTLVYGGGRVGLMRAMVEAIKAAGGKVVGVMPADLVSQEIAHTGLTELRVVNSMHERKWAMAELADGFLCLPGGPGTFEEIFEQWTWALLGFHAKPCGFVNVSGYYEPMRATIQHMADNGFIGQQYVDMLIYAEIAAEVIDRFRTYVAPPRGNGRNEQKTLSRAGA